MQKTRRPKPKPSEQELTARRDILVQHLADIGLKPEDVPEAMREMRERIRADLADLNSRSTHVAELG